MYLNYWVKALTCTCHTRVQLPFVMSSRNLFRIRIATECPLNCATSGMECLISQVRRKTVTFGGPVLSASYFPFRRK